MTFYILQKIDDNDRELEVWSVRQMTGRAMQVGSPLFRIASDWLMRREFKRAAADGLVVEGNFANNTLQFEIRGKVERIPKWTSH